MKKILIVVITILLNSISYNSKAAIVISQKYQIGDTNTRTFKQPTILDLQLKIHGINISNFWGHGFNFEIVFDTKSTVNATTDSISGNWELYRVAFQIFDKESKKPNLAEYQLPWNTLPIKCTSFTDNEFYTYRSTFNGTIPEITKKEYITDEEAVRRILKQMIEEVFIKIQKEKLTSEASVKFAFNFDDIPMSLDNVELKGTVNNNYNSIYWSTDEKNNDIPSFDIEKYNNGSWNIINSIHNNTDITNYYYEDYNVNGDISMYRLSYTHSDNTFYSKVLTLHNNISKKVNIYPNPIVNNTFIITNASVNDDINIFLYNGKKVLFSKRQYHNNVEINILENIPTGPILINTNDINVHAIIK